MNAPTWTRILPALLIIGGLSGCIAGDNFWGSQATLIGDAAVSGVVISILDALWNSLTGLNIA